MKLVYIFSLFLALGLLPLASAFTWEEYEGFSSWKVEVTEDLSDCDSGMKSSTYAGSIEHQKQIAIISDFGHGRIRGGFTGNTFHFPGITVEDSGGQSRISSFDVPFAPDCMSFYVKYNWVFTHPNPTNNCVGTTELRGTRTVATGCPGAVTGQTSSTQATQLRKQIEDARLEDDEKQREALYNEILAKDPANFWANWDMAQLRKEQGQFNDYFKFVDKAITTKNINETTRTKLKQQIAEDNALTRLPTLPTSNLLRKQKDEIDSWSGGNVFGVELKQEEVSDKPSLPFRIWTWFSKKANKLVDKVVGLPGSG